VVTDVDGASAEAVAIEIGERAEAFALDVCDADAFATLAANVVARHGGLDLLVNNAGTAVGGEVQDLELEHWRRVIDVNLNGVVHGIRAAYPAMIASGRGQIVNVASVAGLGPAPLLTPYGLTKWAVVGLSRSLRAEAAAYGIGVTVVCPGVIDTPLLERSAPDGMSAPPSTPVIRSWVSRDLGPPYPADAFAQDVLRAVARNRAMLVSPRRAHAAALLLRLFPGLADRVAQRRVRAERRRRSAH
jgi:NAD(P)-dependent dehydrogenase (short-subunit alcohol dehydrogenase family)